MKGMIVKSANYDHARKENKCVACSGSGHYDTSVKGRAPKCAACDGTGQKR